MLPSFPRPFLVRGWLGPSVFLPARALICRAYSSLGARWTRTLGLVIVCFFPALAGWTIPIYWGQGLLFPWGMVPYPVQLTTVIGQPIEVPKYEGKCSSTQPPKHMQHIAYGIADLNRRPPGLRAELDVRQVTSPPCRCIGLGCEYAAQCFQLVA
jgi:hypothetical protein